MTAEPRPHRPRPVGCALLIEVTPLPSPRMPSHLAHASQKLTRAPARWLKKRHVLLAATPPDDEHAAQRQASSHDQEGSITVGREEEDGSRDESQEAESVTLEPPQGAVLVIAGSMGLSQWPFAAGSQA